MFPFTVSEIAQEVTRGDLGALNAYLPNFFPSHILGKTLDFKNAESALFCWSERRDLNSRPPVPQTGALTGLRYAPRPWRL